MRSRTCLLWLLLATCVVASYCFPGDGLETFEEVFQQASYSHYRGPYSMTRRDDVAKAKSNFNAIIREAHTYRIDPCALAWIDLLSMVHRRMANDSSYADSRFLHRYTLAVAKICNSNVYSNLAEIEGKLSAPPDLDIFKDHNANFNITQLSAALGSEVVSQLPPEELQAPKEEDLFVGLGLRRRYTFNITLPVSEREKVERKLEACNQYVPYYENAIMSIARLAAHGYVWKQESLFSDGEQKKMKKKSAKLTNISPDDRHLLKKWSNIARQCEFVLHNTIDYSTDLSGPIIRLDSLKLRVEPAVNYNILFLKGYKNMISFSRNVESTKQFEEILKTIDDKSMVRDTYEAIPAPFRETAEKKELERRNRSIWSKMGEAIGRVFVKSTCDPCAVMTPFIVMGCVLYILVEDLADFGKSLVGGVVGLVG